MAYVIDVAQSCQTCGSRRQVTKRVHDRQNRIIGTYCTKCAKAMLRKVQDVEDSEDRANGLVKW